MKRWVFIVGLAAAVAWGLAAYVQADCGACGSAPEKAGLCGAGCTKPCCAAPAVKKTACGRDGTKTCPTGKKACGPGWQKQCGPGKATCGIGGKSPCTTVGGAPKTGRAEVNTSALKALLDAGVGVTLLDARTGKYDDGRRIPGASALSSKASSEDAAELIPSKDALVVTYCSNLQCPASGRLAKSLKALGYKNVIEYPQGIAGWADDAGNPVKNVK